MLDGRSVLGSAGAVSNGPAAVRLFGGNRAAQALFTKPGIPGDCIPMIDTPQITQSAAQLTAVIRLTIPRAEIQKVMGPAIGG